jgi:hypothetical protein
MIQVMLENDMLLLLVFIACVVVLPPIIIGVLPRNTFFWKWIYKRKRKALKEDEKALYQYAKRVMGKKESVSAFLELAESNYSDSLKQAAKRITLLNNDEYTMANVFSIFVAYYSGPEISQENSLEFQFYLTTV